MAKRKRTEDLIATLASGPQPPRLWPVFPLAPAFWGTIVGLVVVLTAGVHVVTFDVLSGPGFSMAVLSVTALVLGTWLSLHFASPTARPEATVVGTLIAAVYTVVTAVARSPLPTLAQFFECLLVVVLMSVPTLFICLRLLSRAATLHPSLLGTAAGLFAAGWANIIFLLHCPDLFTGAGIHAQVSALLMIAILGAMVGPRLLKW